MRCMKKLWYECLVYYRKCCNEMHEEAMVRVSSILKEVL